MRMIKVGQHVWFYRDLVIQCHHGVMLEDDGSDFVRVQWLTDDGIKNGTSYISKSFVFETKEQCISYASKQLLEYTNPYDICVKDMLYLKNLIESEHVLHGHYINSLEFAIESVEELKNARFN